MSFLKALLVCTGFVFLCGCTVQSTSSVMTISMSGTNLTNMRLLVSPDDKPAVDPEACGTGAPAGWCTFASTANQHNVTATVDRNRVPYAVYSVNNNLAEDRDVTIVITHNGSEILRHNVTVLAGTIQLVAKVN